MKPGSLVECIKYTSGWYWVKGVPTKLLPDIQKGEIKTVKYITDGIIEYDDGTIERFNSLILGEDEGAIHPDLEKLLTRYMANFREIQPPLTIQISDLLPEEITA